MIKKLKKISSNTRTLATLETGTISPKPTVANVVTLKYTKAGICVM
jgi:hypothetical protein